MIREEKGRGGSRQGAGRPKLINDPVTIGFRVERTDKDLLFEKYGKGINDMFRSWVKSLINGK